MPGNTANRRFVFPVALLFSSNAPGFKNGPNFKLKLQRCNLRIHHFLSLLELLFLVMTTRNLVPRSSHHHMRRVWIWGNLSTFLHMSTHSSAISAAVRQRSTHGCPLLSTIIYTSSILSKSCRALFSSCRSVHLSLLTESCRLFRLERQLGVFRKT